MERMTKYDFHVGDEVITKNGEVGKIIAICHCDKCHERGFDELIWSRTDIDSPCSEYVTLFDMKDGFSDYYKIGKYRFAEFDRDYIYNELDRIEKELKTLEKQAQVIARMSHES